MHLLALLTRKRDWGISFMIKDYIKCQKGIVLSILVAVILFPFFESLLNIGIEDSIYSVLLYVVIMCLYLSYDFYQFKKKYKKLKEIRNSVTTHIQEIPEACNPYDATYQDIVKNLYEAMNDTIGQIDKNNTENLEYYTLWIHQIKTPIAAIHLVLQNMEDIPQKAVLEQELFKIEQYVELALQFIKIGNIESDLVINEYSLGDIIRQSVRKYSVLFIHKGLGVNIKECDETITTDSKWFAFILEQIFSNAVKYTNHGSIQIYTRKEPMGTWLTIEDSGIGIKKEDRNRIFEKGYTGFNGRLDKKASGIGLYLVKKVANALNHDILIESEVSKGTKVHIFIKNYLAD
jgi:signal transduction histidine kinase